jgi:hypothetical protein
MKKFLLFISIVLISLTIWFQRNIFFEIYNPEYVHNYYSFSQWALPLSSRTMGDGDLFSYSGYSLTNNFKPFSVNPETPIFAKLFFGYSIKYLNNPSFASLLFLTLLIWGLDILVSKYFNFSNTKRILLSLLVFTNAEIQLQVTSSVLDLPQVMLFVWHLVFLFKFHKNKSKKIVNLVISGLLLGLMSATKPAIYTPFILLGDFLYLSDSYTNNLYKNFKKLFIINNFKLITVLTLTTACGYLIPYLPIIISAGIENFITAQKWIANFYLISKVKAPIGMILITSLTGFYKGWAGSEWRLHVNWDVSWGIGLISFLMYLYNWFKNNKQKNNELKVILFILLFVILILIKIPFWPRYFVFLIPFFWILILNYIKDKNLLLLLLIFPIISTSNLIFQSYQVPTQPFEYIESASYEELYINYFSTKYKEMVSINNFVKNSLNEYEDLHPNIIDIKILEEHKTNTEIKQIVLVTLKGFYGEKETIKEIYWIREHDQWKILNIKITNESIIIIDNLGSLICINPVKVKDWSKVYKATTDYFKLEAHMLLNVNDIVMRLVPRDYCIPIGISSKNLPTFPPGIEIISRL